MSDNTEDNNATTTPDADEHTENTDDANVTTKAIPPLHHEYSENDSQNTVYAIVGDTIVVNLEENPTTGYSWNMTYSSGLELREDMFLQESMNVNLVGAGGSHKWIFKVTDTEEQSISAVYIRPWEERTGTENNYDLIIRVLAENKLITDKGKVTYNDIEGGFYGIIGTSDVKYDPVNLPEELSTDGTEVRFTAYPRDDMMSFHMWGQIIELRTINQVL
ncbi:protease inhibitor I42 family protein [Methanolobus sp. ZRKC5]|uniref:protease inhibitor I42 family protein n=1 Tax=Methanolobus sp. ZRKC5 TaxID=3136295 RepID=UPI00313B0353